MHRNIHLSWLTCLQLVACAADASTNDAASASSAHVADLGVLREAVKNGVEVSADDYSSAVRLWQYNSQFDELRQICSGVLYRNDVVLTAKHCVIRTEEQINYGWPDTHADTSQIIVTSAGVQFVASGQGAPMLAPNGADIAAFYLSQSLPVRSNGEIRQDGYTHPLGSVSSQTAVGVYGFSFATPDQTSSVCKYVSQDSGERLPGCVGDPLRLTMYWDYPRVSDGNLELDNLIVLPGDSGGMTTTLNLYEPDLADLQLVGINSYLLGCADEACGHTSFIARVDYLGEWFATF